MVQAVPGNVRVREVALHRKGRSSAFQKKRLRIANVQQKKHGSFWQPKSNEVGKEF